MNSGILKRLIAVNMLYINPSYTNQIRKKGRIGKQVIRSIIQQYVMSGVIFLLIYGATMIMIDFAKLPGFFTYYMVLFALIGFSQSLSAIFNVFFESKDLQDYLPLPIKQGEVFISKFLAVGMTIVPFLLPLLILFFLTAFKSGYSVVLSVVGAILLFLIFFFLLFSLCSLIVFGMTKTKLFRQHKKLFTSLMLGFSMIVSVGGILAINFTQSSMEHTAGVVDRHAFTVFMPFYHVMHGLTTQKGLITLAGLLVLTGLLLLALRFFVIPSLYEQFSDEGSHTVATKRKRKTNQSLKKLLAGYNRQLLKNPNLIMQVLTSSLIMPIVMVGTMVTTNPVSLQTLTPKFMGVFFVAGIVFACIMLNQTSFVSNLISLDRENFSFIQSLPLSLEKYLRQKFWVGCKIQMLIAGGVGLVISIVLQLPLFLMAPLNIGILWGTYLMSLYFFSRDYRLLNVTWTNVSQLFTRGVGNFGLMIWMFGTLFIGAVLIVLYVVAVLMNINPVLLNGGVMIWLAILSIAWLLINRNNFWKKLGD
ncbi:ABC transporter [Enterococcus sp.]|uniref:ABC transporter n=1 Tax=Enterococcus sp. TaxID=35783 RepID=UPI0029125865|nr:ABC transporter [Enterococcus sp.]MDU5335214.1 ABC transporter [Enterococcus sp.]